MPKAKKSQFENSKFIRTDKPHLPRCSSHNVRRHDWIAKAGTSGRSFSEINAPDSIYRRNIIRKKYLGNNSMIDEDLRYDIKSGYIRELTN